MKTIRTGVSPRLILLMFFAIVVPAGLLVLFGLKAVTGERYVLEHKILAGFREGARALALSEEQQLKAFEHSLGALQDVQIGTGRLHPFVGTVFVLGGNDRVVSPPRLKSRRENPAVFEKEYSADFTQIYAREVAGDASACQGYLSLGKRERSVSSEESGLLDAARWRCLLRDSSRVVTPPVGESSGWTTVSPRLLEQLGRYGIAYHSKDSLVMKRALRELLAELLSDTLSLYQEEFRFYADFIVRELVHAGSLPDSLQVREKISERINRNTEIELLETRLTKGEWQDSAFVYWNKNIYYLWRTREGGKVCLKIRPEVLSEWARVWAEKRDNLAVTLGFTDGRVLYSSVGSGEGDAVMAVTEGLSRRLPFLNVTVGEKKQGEIYSMIQRQRVLYLLFLGVLLLAIASGAGLVYAGVRREVEIARMRSNFISGVSHELRTPLTSIHMLSEMLQTGKITSEKKKSEYYGLITRESERLTDLVNKILDFSKIDEGRIKYEMEALALEALVDDALMAMAPLLDERDAVITRKRSEKTIQVRCDRRMMSQVVVNLLDNAVKYSPKKPDILIRTELRDGMAVLMVRDHGIGIQSSEKERIFEEFYRSGHERVKEVKGTGLGLAIVKKVVEDHQGKVVAQSAEGGGLEVCVMLPGLSVA